MSKNTYTPEIKERAVCMLIEATNNYPSAWAATQEIASEIGCSPETLRSWHKKHITQSIPEAVHAQSFDARIKQLEQANKTLRKAAALKSVCIVRLVMCRYLSLNRGIMRV